MTSLAISDVPWISKRIKACCRRAKLFSTDEILLAPPQQLQQALRITKEDADLLLLQVATASAPPAISVLDALNGNPPAKLDENLFDVDVNDADPSDDSEDSDVDQGRRTNDTRFPASSIVPPTQGYDGNFPGADRYVYDSDSDSDSERTDAHSDVMMYDDVEMPSTFRPRRREDAAAEQDEGDPTFDSNINNVTVQPSVTRDVLALGRDRHILSSGSQKLDDLLGGGFRSAILTEIVGESGSGKTLIAVQTCTYAALGFVPLPPVDDEDPSSLPSLNLKTVSDDASLREILGNYGMAPWINSSSSSSGLGACYITSSGERSAHSIVNRALDLGEFAIRERFDRIYPPFSSSGTALDRQILLERALQLGREQVLQNLHLSCVSDVEALDHVLKYHLPGLVTRLGASVGVVVVDNLPSLFQEDPVVSNDIDSLVQRSKLLVEIAESLKRLAVSHDFTGSDRVVLVLNHVSDAFGQDKDVARRFVFDTASRVRLTRTSTSTQPVPETAYPDHPIGMDYATQSAFISGLLASIPPTLAEAIGSGPAREGFSNGEGGLLYNLHPRTAQLGHTWTNLVNVRLFLSKTRGRVAMPDQNHTSNSGEAEGEGANKGKAVMATVRKAAVVINPFGETMLDVSPTDSAKGRKTGGKQMRFIITRSSAVHALMPYNLTNTTSTTTATATTTTTTTTTTAVAAAGAAAGAGPSINQVTSQSLENQEEEDFFDQLDTLDETHLLAIDLLEESASLPNTPLSH
ncbi:related to DNA repair/recombination protein Rec2 [Ustilago trichophora]|uniref:Related to DNA repair/recombination protein Rec2 n=1 Tax=Ustilago trichophora TaxID=86804 RepID=A0A5C3DZI9_9BASI|nr:related to DNA repair/recombination protein Rec2 [Ustilago trichophora]